MKKFNRFFLLVVLMLLSSALFACNDNSKTNNGEDDPSTDVEEETNVLDQTGEFIFNNNESEYTIVIPENAMEKEILAKDELIEFSKELSSYANTYYEMKSAYMNCNDFRIRDYVTTTLLTTRVC